MDPVSLSLELAMCEKHRYMGQRIQWHVFLRYPLTVQWPLVGDQVERCLLSSVMTGIS